MRKPFLPILRNLFQDDSWIDHILSKEFDGSVISTYAYRERLVKKVREKKKDVLIILIGFAAHF